MKLAEINSTIVSLEKIGEIELLMHYYKRKKNILTTLAHNFKSKIQQTIASKGIGALNTEELEVAQYLYDNKELSL